MASERSLPTPLSASANPPRPPRHAGLPALRDCRDSCETACTAGDPVGISLNPLTAATSGGSLPGATIPPPGTATARSTSAALFSLSLLAPARDLVGLARAPLGLSLTRSLTSPHTMDSLDPAQLAVAACGTVLAALLSYALYCRFFHPLAGIPGPLRARFGTGGWLTVRGAKRDFGWQLKALHDKHGPFVRIGRNMVSVTDPRAVDDLYKFGGPVKDKAPFYQFFVRRVSSLGPTTLVDAPCSSRKSRNPRSSPPSPIRNTSSLAAVSAPHSP